MIGTQPKNGEATGSAFFRWSDFACAKQPNICSTVDRSILLLINHGEIRRRDSASRQKTHICLNIGP
jgi:hypothetical protein